MPRIDTNLIVAPVTPGGTVSRTNSASNSVSQADAAKKQQRTIIIIASAVAVVIIALALFFAFRKPKTSAA